MGVAGVDSEIYPAMLSSTQINTRTGGRIMGLPIDATLGERIRFYRQQAGLTQKELAGLCEVSESAIRNYELGNRVPDFLTLHTIAEKLRVNYTFLHLCRNVS